MSGKKQSQRTKNNVRPSSSSRSAELLNHSMSFDGGLMTVSGGKVLSALFPTLATVNFDQGLKPEYQICIKKLNKKDPITRTKALQELCELVNNGNVDDAVAILPAWAHCYKTLTSDTDRKVREMTQLCHGALVRVCGRRSAPQLKALLPPWLQAQYDEHAPAMTLAQNSLKSTFPDSKLPDVISFCKSEVMALLLDNLIGNTEAIISKKIEDVEERELQMGRIITGSLRGLEFFVPQLPAPHHEWLWAELAPLLAEPAFWKMSNHTMHLVRAAWFGVVGRLAERFGGRFGAAHGARAWRVLLGVARDPHALRRQQRWTCLLQLMHHVPDWHKYLDKKELLVKRILDVLEAGGWGDARQLSTMLLPLLAHLPQDVLTKEFYESFFSAVYKGFEKKNVITSKSERQSWITGLAECLRYVSIQENDFAVEVVTSAHRTWLEKTLSSRHDVPTRNNLIKCSAANMTSLVKYWLKQSNEGKSEKYDQLLRNFWQNVGSTLLAQIDGCGTDLAEIETLIDAHILLLQCLKTSFSQETKKQLSIKFEETAGEERESVASDTPAVYQECDPTCLERYSHNLEELVHRVISAYFSAAEQKQAADAILSPLITLLRQFDSARVFGAVATHFGAGSALGLHERVLRRWLAGDTMRCKAVVDIVFLMVKHLEEHDQDAVFDSFRELTPAVSAWCVARSVAHPHVQLSAARRWLRSPAAAAALQTLARRALSQQDSGAAHLLLGCLADTPAGESLFSEEAVSEMLKMVSAAVTLIGETETETKDEGSVSAEAMSSSMEFSSRLVARLVTALAASPERALLQPFAELVLHLLRLNVLVPRGSARLAAATWVEARSSWRDGLAALSALSAPARRALLHRAAVLLTTHFDNNIEKLDVQKIEDTVSLAPYLFIRGDESQLPDDLTEIITFTKQLFDMDTKESVAVETCALRHECVTLHLNCLYEDNDIIKTIIEGSAETDLQELSKSEATAYMNKLLFRAIYLRTLLLHKAVSEDDADDDDAKTWCDTLFNSEYLESEFCKILYDYNILLSLHEAYTFWPDYSIIEKTKSKMDAILSDVISASSEASRQKVVTSLKKLASAKGYYWAYAHRYYCVSARKEDDQGSLCDTGEKILEPTTTAHFHMLQAVCKFGGRWEEQYRTAFLVMLRGFQERHSEELSTELLLELEASKAGCDVGVIARHYSEQGYTLFDEKLSEAPWSAVVSGASVADFLRLALAGQARPVPWAFVNPVLAFLFQSVTNSLDQWGSLKMGVVLLAALRLLDTVLCPASSSPTAPATPSPSATSPPAPAPAPPPPCGWKEYENTVYDAIYTTVVHILEHGQSRSLTVAQSAALGALVAALGGVDWFRAPRAPRAGGRALAAAPRAPRRAPPGARAAPRPGQAARLPRRARNNRVERERGGEGAARDLPRRVSPLVRGAAADRRDHAQQCRAGRRDLRVGEHVGQPQHDPGLAPAGGRSSPHVGTCHGGSQANLHSYIHATQLRERAAVGGAAAAAGRAVRVGARRQRQGARAPALRRHVPAHRALLHALGVLERGGACAGVPLRGAHGDGRGLRRRARVAERGAGARGAGAGAAGGGLRVARRRARAVRAAAAARARDRGRQRAHRLGGARGGVRVQRGGERRGAAAVARARAPARAAAPRGVRPQRRRHRALARALPHLPERHAAERAEDLDEGGERARGEGAAVLHLLLPPRARHRPPAQRHVPPVPEQVPQRLPGPYPPPTTQPPTTQPPTTQPPTTQPPMSI